MTVKITNQEFYTAHERWHEHWPIKTLQAWGDFLGSGYHNYRQYQDGIWYCEDNVANKIRQLNGPHYRTILRAYAVQHVTDIFDLSVEVAKPKIIVPKQEPRP
jgi:hypothetical protein